MLKSNQQAGQIQELASTGMLIQDWCYGVCPHVLKGVAHVQFNVFAKENPAQMSVVMIKSQDERDPGLPDRFHTSFVATTISIFSSIFRQRGLLNFANGVQFNIA